MSMVDEVFSLQENKYINDFSKWALPNSSDETDIESWKNGMDVFSKSNSDIIMKEVEKIGISK